MFEVARWPRNPWSVFDELDSLHADFNRVLDGWDRSTESAGRYDRASRYRAVYPPMNVWSAEDGIVIDAELPGVDPKAVDISVQGDELTLKGEVNTATADDKAVCYRRERPSGSFTRTLRLPFRADSSAVRAQYRNGVLRLSIPRPEEEKPKKIAIEAA